MTKLIILILPALIAITNYSYADNINKQLTNGECETAHCVMIYQNKQLTNGECETAHCVMEYQNKQLSNTFNSIDSSLTKKANNQTNNYTLIKRTSRKNSTFLDVFLNILGDIPAPFIWIIVISWLWGMYEFLFEGGYRDDGKLKFFGLLFIFPFFIIGIASIRGIFGFF